MWSISLLSSPANSLWAACFWQREGSRAQWHTEISPSLCLTPTTLFHTPPSFSVTQNCDVCQAPDIWQIPIEDLPWGHPVWRVLDWWSHIDLELKRRRCSSPNSAALRLFPNALVREWLEKLFHEHQVGRKCWKVLLVLIRALGLVYHLHLPVSFLPARGSSLELCLALW